MFTELPLLSLLIWAPILGGIWVWAHAEEPSTANLSPFLPHGVGGLVQAMGFTFIAFHIPLTSMIISLPFLVRM